MSYMPCTCTICEKVINEVDAYYSDVPICEDCYLELHQTEEDYRLFRKGESNES